MIKNNRIKILISSIIILLPIVAGLILWDYLPDNMATHFGSDGNADGFSNKYFAVFGLPIIILILHFVCIFATSFDHKNKDQSKKIFGMIFWITPVISIYSSAITYALALGMEIDIGIITLMLIGIMFIFFGNYLPKCKQNYTIGIKLPWTVYNEENWNKTHRLAGKLWVAGGILLLASVFLPNVVKPFISVMVLAVLIIIPMLYSYLIYKKSGAEKIAVNRNHKITTAISLIFVIAILIFVLVICFTGNIKIHYDNDYFILEASYFSDLTVNYADIESIEYREEDDIGERTNGFGSPRLLMGTFKNEEFGTYARYSYAGCDSCIVIASGGKTLVINGIDEETTKDIYEKILLKAG